tara:strand:- start:11872 stop:15069 length:3198 start_codon:yes stop_codon:yes gene_type:complete
MASVTQTIPSFTGGISEQPDQLKFPGQVKDVVNAIPDITRGLYKRPGAKRVGTTPLANVQSGGSWFHYHRDDEEGSYIGQVAADGQLRMWKADGDNAGAPQNITYGTGGQTAIQNYLATNNSENIQFLTINDTTFVSSRDITNANTLVGSTGTTAANPNAHFAFIEITRTENGRQYGLNIYDNSTPTSFKRATRIKIKRDTLDESGGTGQCRGIGIQTFSVDAATSYTGSNTVNVRGTQAQSATTFASTAINVSNEQITITNHGFEDEDEVTYTAGDPAGSLTSGTKYYIIVIDANTIALAATIDEAKELLSINISSQGTGNHTLTPTENARVTSGKKNLIFKLDIRGQQGTIGADGDSNSDYACAYARSVILLHGGEGWETGDTVRVTMDQAKGRTVTGTVSSGTSSNSGLGESPATYVIEVTEHEEISVKSTVFGGTAGNGRVRPEPTPFDSDTAVSGDQVLGGILAELPTGITGTIIGNGIYMSANNPFNVEIVEDDLMRSMGTSVNDVTLLPKQCKHGYIVKIANARISEEDDYYLRFEGLNDEDGTGSWTECAKPGIAKSLTNMPLVIQRTALNNPGTSSEVAEFTIKQFVYADREVGDDSTNRFPTFLNKRINKVLFFRNRLAFLSEENVILSRPGTVGKPDFFAETALTVSANDPIDIACSSTFPSELFDGIDINSGLVVFSTNQQFLLSSDDTVLNPDTAKLRSISTFNYNKDIPPISLGTTVAYIDDSGKFSRFNEMANIAREGEPNVVNQSQVVPTLLPKNIDLLTNSRENNLVIMGQTNSDTVQGFRYLNVGDKRQQSAWFKWKFNNPLLYHFIINDEYYFLDTDNFLQSIRLVQQEADPSITQDNVEFLLHVDNYTTVSNGSYDAATKLTTFTNQSDWIDQVTTPNYDLAVIDTNTASARVGRYGKPTVINNDDFTLPGDWSGVTLTIGYLYEYSVAFPTFYLARQQGEANRADVNSSLVLHRIKLHFGKIGLYETTLTRVGKTDYTEVYESTELDEYQVSDAPYLEEFIKTVPIYEKNTNVDITLKSSHPAPSTLRALSWEGDYSPKYYKRV